jgi:hypothetical protein
MAHWLTSVGLTVVCLQPQVHARQAVVLCTYQRRSQVERENKRDVTHRAHRRRHLHCASGALSSCPARCIPPGHTLSRVVTLQSGTPE